MTRKICGFILHYGARSYFCDFLKSLLGYSRTRLRRHYDLFVSVTGRVYGVVISKDSWCH